MAKLGQAESTRGELTIRRRNGVSMMVVGGLIAFLSGSCTGWVGWPWRWGIYWAFPAVIGGLPFFAGVCLFISGWVMWRRAGRALLQGDPDR